MLNHSLSAVKLSVICTHTHTHTSIVYHDVGKEKGDVMFLPFLFVSCAPPPAAPMETQRNADTGIYSSLLSYQISPLSVSSLSHLHTEASPPPPSSSSRFSSNPFSRLSRLPPVRRH